MEIIFIIIISTVSLEIPSYSILIFPKKIIEISVETFPAAQLPFS
jgi:hypothetical protein